jgi:chemotaxis protein MotB
VPIKTARFPSNWELSAARAIAMMRVLADRFQVDPQRFSVTGYADTVPVESNDTADGRAKNRRVDVVILSEYGLRSTAEGQAGAEGHAAPEATEGKHEAAPAASETPAEH